MTRLRAGQPRTRVSIPSKGDSLIQASRPDLGSTQPSAEWVPGSFPGVKRELLCLYALYFIFLFYTLYIHTAKTHPFLGNLPSPRFIHIFVQNKGIPFTKCIEFDFHSYCIGLMMAL